MSEFGDLEQIDLSISGMTCSSCVATVERALNRVPGAQSSVNLVTESAHVLAPRGTTTRTLIDAVRSAGYEAKIRTDELESFANSRTLGWRLILAILLTIPVIVISMAHSLHAQVDDFVLTQLDRFEIPPPLYSPSGWLAIGLSAPVVLILAWPIHRAALRNLLHPTMDNLISLGSITALIWSIYANATGAGDIYAEVGSAVVTFIMFGRYLESVAKRRAGSALSHLLALNPKEVRLLRGNEEVMAPIANVVVGDRTIVRPGERFPTDGIVIEGASSADNSLMTGESLPVELVTGSRVIAGGINLSGRLVIQAVRVGSDTELSRMTKMVIAAQAEKAPIQRLADRISSIFVPIVLLLALATLIGWQILGYELAPSISAAVAVLVIACPCALGLATPVALLVASGVGARNGAILRRAAVLEIAPKIDTVVLDKTGTLTTGVMRVERVLNLSDLGIDSDLSINQREIDMAAFSMVHESNHPISAAIARQFAAAGLPRKSITDYVESSGQGAAARIQFADQKLPVLIGNPESIRRATLALNPQFEAAITAARMRGNSVSILAIDGCAVCLYEVGDTLRSEAKEFIASLRESGIESWLITGDSLGAAGRIADEVGIAAERVIAGASPTTKLEQINALRQEGRRVLMIGDGVNDAAALSAADLSMAMGTGTDTAIASADITLLRDPLYAARFALKLSQRTLRTIKANLSWAFLYNVIGIPIAALGALSPMYAGGAMAISSLFVVFNSLRLNRTTSLSA